MGRHLRVYMGLAVAICLFTACGQAKLPDMVEQDSIVVGQDGGITAYIVRDFDKDYYELSELTVMAREEASDYNNKNGENAVTARAIELLEDGSSRVRAIYDYLSYSDYNGFNEDRLFYGTVREAVSEGKAGELFSASELGMSDVKSVKDGSPADADKLADRHMIVTDADALIYCPGQAAYLSEGAVLNEDGSVDTAQTGETVIIILKK